ncbi:hypothetical protein ACS0TY_033927 [Phlomoides rotata]
MWLITQQSFTTLSKSEMRDFSSQLYNAADYWKSSFLKSQDKKLIIESIKDYILKLCS